MSETGHDSRNGHEEFLARRDKNKDRINGLDRGLVADNPKRTGFFETVYDTAGSDASLVPWADLRAKPQLLDWLAENPGRGKRAIDVACGLGDNAEALAASGYETLAFDFSQRAIDWARERFPNSAVDYQVGDLFELPDAWKGAFDLVHECYTLQSIPPETLEQSVPAIASLVAPAGLLLVYTRIVEDGTEVEGPPWPLEASLVDAFRYHGLENLSHQHFSVKRPDREIPHVFSLWRRPA